MSCCYVAAHAEVALVTYVKQRMRTVLHALSYWNISVWVNACTHLDITQPIQVQVSIRAVALHGDDLQVATKVASIEPADGQAVPVSCQHSRPILIVLHNAAHAAPWSEIPQAHHTRLHVLQNDCEHTQDTDAQEDRMPDYTSPTAAHTADSSRWRL